MIPPPESGIIREAAARALGEDLGPADITTLALIPRERLCRARIFSKEPGILSGVILAEAVLREVSPQIQITRMLEDGSILSPGSTVLELSGPAHAILSGERTALNFLLRLSGIATLTSRYVAAVGNRPTKILDTRKTTPGLRALEKYAVRCGGGVNHRIGLYDAFMAKDNHLAFSDTGGNLQAVVEKLRAFDPDAHLTMEADTLEQVRQLAGLRVDRILLDNMTNEQLKEAVTLVAHRCETEASGNMTLERIPHAAETGVDFISVGALTHSATALDFSLEILPS